MTEKKSLGDFAIEDVALWDLGDIQGGQIVPSERGQSRDGSCHHGHGITAGQDDIKCAPGRVGNTESWREYG